MKKNKIVIYSVISILSLIATILNIDALRSSSDERYILILLGLFLIFVYLYAKYKLIKIILKNRKNKSKK